MSFRATQSLFSKASRMPLTSKRGNKDFYKGTGSHPGMGFKRQGRHSPRSKAPYLLMAERMNTFVVPDLSNVADLKPYVDRNSTSHRDNSWPMAQTKPEDDRFSKRGGRYSPSGFDGHYYLQLAQLKAPSE